jgi:hypothetical protein
MFSMRVTTAAPSGPSVISPPLVMYGGSPAWKFGAS